MGLFDRSSSSDSDDEERTYEHVDIGWLLSMLRRGDQEIGPEEVKALISKLDEASDSQKELALNILNQFQKQKKYIQFQDQGDFTQELAEDIYSHIRSHPEDFETLIGIAMELPPQSVPAGRFGSFITDSTGDRLPVLVHVNSDSEHAQQNIYQVLDSIPRDKILSDATIDGLCRYAVRSEPDEANFDRVARVLAYIISHREDSGRAVSLGEVIEEQTADSEIHYDVELSTTDIGVQREVFEAGLGKIHICSGVIPLSTGALESIDAERWAKIIKEERRNQPADPTPAFISGVENKDIFHKYPTVLRRIVNDQRYETEAAKAMRRVRAVRLADIFEAEPGEPRQSAMMEFVNSASDNGIRSDKLVEVLEHLSSVDRLSHDAAQTMMEVSGGIDTIVDIVRDGSGKAKQEATKSLLEAVSENPKDVATSIDRECLDSLRPGQRTEIAEPLLAVFTDAPDTVTDGAAALLYFLSYKRTAEQASQTVLDITEQDPDILQPYASELASQLAEHSSVATKNLAEALGNIGDDAAAEELRSLRQAEEEDIRVVAESALRQVRQTETSQPAQTQQAPTESTSRAGSGPGVDITAVRTADDLTDDATDFENVRKLGSGGNADVYEARVDGTTVALKQPRFQSQTLGGEVVERFFEEAETWAKIDDHDHIITVRDVGRKPYPWIAMEYMEGGNLGAYFDDLSPTEALDVTIDIIRAIRHAHRRGIAHLDLKPENVLFTRENGDLVAKVGDWGLSKMMIDHSKSIEGYTPQYAAPEQFDSDGYGSPDDYTDMYQIGAILYELLTDEPPFSGSPATIMHGVLNKQPTPPTEVNPELPPIADEALARALAKDKADRYESVLYFRDDLEELRQQL